jgi:O-antigen/teichoic acid export membrane protein
VSAVDEAEHHLDRTEAGGLAIRGGVLRLTGYVVGLASSLLAGAILLRHLDPASFGRLAIVIQLTVITAGLADAGLVTLATRELSLRPLGPERDTYLRNLMGVRLLLVAIGAGVAIGYAAMGWIGPGLVAGTVIMCLAMLLQNVQSSLSSPLLADLKLGTVAVADLIRQVVTAAGIIALALLGSELNAYFWVAVVAAAATLGFTAYVVRGRVPLRPAFDRRMWRSLLANSVPFAVAASVGAIYFRVVILVVELLSTKTQVGLFGASFRVIEVLLIVPLLVVGSAFPIFARSANSDAQRFGYALQRMLDATLILGATMALLLVVGAPVALRIVAGPQYEAAAGVLRWHGLALLFSCCGAVFGYGLLSLKAYRGLLAANFAALLVNIVAAVILVQVDGAQGGALSTLAGEITLVVVGAVALARARGGVRLTIPGGPRLALAAALAAAPALVLKPLPATIAAAAIFALLVLVLRVVPQELVVEARVAVRRVWRFGGQRM